MDNPNYLTIYQVTCPDCGANHYLYGWQPVSCPYCGEDLGGCSKGTLHAIETYYPVSVNPLTGEVTVRPEWA
jgi:ribosomal protein S27E